MDNDCVSEELDEWQEIPSPWSMDKAQWISEISGLSENSVFPPIHQQKTLSSMATPQENQIQESSEAPLYSNLPSSSSSSNSPDDDGDAEVDNEGVEGEKRVAGESAWSSRVAQVMRRMKNYAVCRISWWSSALATTGVLSMVLLSLWCVKVQRWRKRVQMERVEQLMLLIKERDQKINQLLLRIAHMNEILLARRSVPVIRVA